MKRIPIQFGDRRPAIMYDLGTDGYWLRPLGTHMRVDDDALKRHHPNVVEVLEMVDEGPMRPNEHPVIVANHANNLLRAQTESGQSLPVTFQFRAAYRCSVSDGGWVDVYYEDGITVTCEDFNLAGKLLPPLGLVDVAELLRDERQS